MGVQLGPGTFTSTGKTTGIYEGLVPYGPGEWRVTSVFGAYESFRKRFPARQPDGSIVYVDVGPHRGMDIAAPHDRPLFALAPGKVRSVGDPSTNPAFANWITIEHQSRNILTGRPHILTRYLHLSDDPVLKVGDQVRRGDVIGLTGQTGKATGDHVHINLYVGRHAVDPMSLIVPVLELEKMSRRKLARKVMLKLWAQDYDSEFEGLEAILRIRLDV